MGYWPVLLLKMLFEVVLTCVLHADLFVVLESAQLWPRVSRSGGHYKLATYLRSAIKTATHLTVTTPVERSNVRCAYDKQ